MPTTITHEQQVADFRSLTMKTEVTFNETDGLCFASIISETIQNEIPIVGQELHIQTKEQALAIARTILSYCRGELDNANNHNDNIEIPA